jgi:serine/threonine protein kinase
MDGASCTFIASDVHCFLVFLMCRYVEFHQLSEKSDVYSFAVILLELISGEPPMPTDNSRVAGHLNIVAWVTVEDAFFHSFISLILLCLNISIDQ